MLKKDEIADPNSCLNRATDDMPIFVLKAPDKCAIHAMRAWIDAAVMMKVNETKLNGAFDALENFLRWQSENPEQVKTPD